MSLNGNILTSAHTLIAGTTGSGKSTLLHSFIYYTMKTYQPNNVKFVLIDLKRVELAKYKNLKHTMTYANNVKDAEMVLSMCQLFMRNRYAEMEKQGQTESIYNHIYIIIDELADLIAQSKKAVDLIASIGRLGRASHIHLILATQSPDRKTLCAKIQQNITNTIALRCKTAIESRQVLGISGAETLTALGDVITWNGSQGYAKDHFNKVPSNELDNMVKMLSKK